jgi:hypothetical protein
LAEIKILVQSDGINFNIAVVALAKNLTDDELVAISKTIDKESAANVLGS